MELAVGVSVAALIVSIAVAIWNVAKFVRDGAQVRVKLQRGMLADYGALWQGPFGSQSTVEPDHDLSLALHREIAVIEVENLGRTAVTITEPAIDLGLEMTRGRRRPFRRTVSPSLVKFRDSATESRVRLEPFDFTTFMFDLAVILGNIEREGATLIGSRTLRGSVRVAGKRWRRRSPRRKGFRLPSDQQLSVDGSHELGQVAYRALCKTVGIGPGKVSDGTAQAHRAARVVRRLGQQERPLTQDSIESELKSDPLWPESASAEFYAAMILEAIDQHGIAPSRSVEQT